MDDKAYFEQSMLEACKEIQEELAWDDKAERQLSIAFLSFESEWEWYTGEPRKGDLSVIVKVDSDCFDLVTELLDQIESRGCPGKEIVYTSKG